MLDCFVFFLQTKSFFDVLFIAQKPRSGKVGVYVPNGGHCLCLSEWVRRHPARTTPLASIEGAPLTLFATFVVFCTRTVLAFRAVGAASGVGLPGYATEKPRQPSNSAPRIVQKRGVAFFVATVISATYVDR